MNLSKFVHSFYNASRGIAIGIKNERNLRIHTLAVIVITIISYILGVSISDFIIFLLLFAMILSSELLNSAIERICNILRDRYNLPYEASRDIRDIAAGAVWIQAFVAVLIAVAVFSKYF